MRKKKNLNGSGNLGDVRIYGKIILKCVIRDIIMAVTIMVVFPNVTPSGLMKVY
jgi:hypothetical protein